LKNVEDKFELKSLYFFINFF